MELIQKTINYYHQLKIKEFRNNQIEIQKIDNNIFNLNKPNTNTNTHKIHQLQTHKNKYINEEIQYYLAVIDILIVYYNNDNYVYYFINFKTKTQKKKKKQFNIIYF
jgi:hypothetical protein